MGVRHNIPQAFRELEKTAERYEQEVVKALVQAGERAAEVARQTRTYEDKSGNLTASIGYGVVHKGTLVAQGGFDESLEGGRIGREALQKALDEVRQEQYAVVLVAGMEYATYINRKGYAVLDGAQIRIGNIVNELLSKIRL